MPFILASVVYSVNRWLTCTQSIPEYSTPYLHICICTNKTVYIKCINILTVVNGKLNALENSRRKKISRGNFVLPKFFISNFDNGCSPLAGKGSHSDMNPIINVITQDK